MISMTAFVTITIVGVTCGWIAILYGSYELEFWRWVQRKLNCYSLRECFLCHEIVDFEVGDYSCFVTNHEESNERKTYFHDNCIRTALEIINQEK